MQLKLKNVRLAFPSLWEAKQFSPGQGKFKYSATLILDKGDPQNAAIKETLMHVAVEKWGAKGNDMARALYKKGDTCYRDGDEDKADMDGFGNAMFISASNEVKPTILDTDKSQLGPGSGRPYGGCYVNAIIEIWAQDNQFGKKLNASLMGVQFFRDGDAFAGGRPASTDDFDDLSVGDEGSSSAGKADPFA
jgi:hypothetical protein